MNDVHSYQKQFAFVQRNLAKLGLEQQVLLGAHMLTCLFCFFPWVAVTLYGAAPELRNGFTGEVWLMGTLIFILSLGSVVLFLDEVLDIHKLNQRLPFKLTRTRALWWASAGSLLLIIVAWSVLSVVANNADDGTVRFGVVLAAVAQFFALVALYLLQQNQAAAGVQDFFHQTPEPKPVRANVPEPKPEPVQTSILEETAPQAPGFAAHDIDEPAEQEPQNIASTHEDIPTTTTSQSYQLTSETPQDEHTWS